MRTFYIVIVAVAAIGWIGLGLFIAAGPQPEIIVPAEVITKVGPLNITNTLIAAWLTMAFLIVVTFIATRSMKLLPSSLQNFIEAGLEFLLDQIESIAGEKNGRRFFAVIATFFIFILISNWFGLLPFFNAIGKTEDVGHEIFHEIEVYHEEGKGFDEKEHFAMWFVDDTGIGLVNPGAEDTEFEILGKEEAPVSPGEALDHYIVFLAEAFTDFERQDLVDEELSEKELHELVTPEILVAALAALEADPDAPKLLGAGDGHGEEGSEEGDDHAGEGGEAHGHGVPSALLGDELVVSGIHFPDQKLALIIPLFRSVYSDVNNTLALALISFVIVEFWGLQSLGLGYLRKFFNFSSPITAFVGILELLSEFIRIISFAFRLFGNIFAGEVLIIMFTFLIPFLVVNVIYGLELFVGFIQAAVFALLTLVFAVMAVEHHGEDDHEEHAAPGDGHGDQQELEAH